jgi:hypothetical protein
MASITLASGVTALVDDEDEERLARFAWNAQRSPSGTVYARRTNAHDVTVYMHREVMRAAPDMLVDHVDFDGLNNRSKNLRLATSTQNIWHRRQSGPIGVSWLPKLGRWRSRLSVDGKTVDVGRFGTPEEAAFAYDVLCAAVRGDFASLNGSSITAIDELTFSPTARRILFQLRTKPPIA